jgi:predicted RNA binding protein YcfA (HicA-like mRNA interferase family)
MSRTDNLLDQILRANADANISFSGMRRLLAKLGFEERIRGSHHIFVKHGVVEMLNLQAKGAKCKPYQVKQVRHVIVKYKLAEELDA